MTPRATRALEILRNGGKFRYALTRNAYTRREQFQWSLIGANGATARGYGHATYHELVKEGVTFGYEPSGFTGSSTYYPLLKE